MKESILRTLVPVIYVLLINSGIGNLLGLNDQWVQGAAAVIATGLIYVALRYLESHQSKFGWLLGYPAAPSYDSPAPPKKRVAARRPANQRGYGDPRTIGVMAVLFGALGAAFTHLYFLSIIGVGLLLIASTYFMLKHPVRQRPDREPAARRSSARSPRASAVRAPHVAGVHGKL